MNPAIAAVMLVAVLLLASGTGIVTIPQASVVTVDDPSCSPGEIIEPNYAVYECLPESVQNRQGSIQSFYNCGPFGGYVCADISCNYIDLPDGEPCEVRSSNCILDGGQCVNELTIPHGDTQTVTLNPGPFETPNGEVWYRALYLNYEDKQTGYETNIKGGCTLSKTLTGSAYEALPEEDRDRHLSQYESVTTIVGYDSYPYAGNYVDYNGEDAVCRSTGTQERVVYSLVKTESLSGCYYHEGNVLEYVDCCPGETSLDGRQCGDDFTWTDVGGCCLGGVCSVGNCPGGGSWDWDGWSVGDDTVSRYTTCSSITGECGGVETRPAECDLESNEGCPTGQTCEYDDGGYVCRDTVQPEMTCSEAGYECCLPGMFPYVTDTVTCADAGKDGQNCVNGYCFEPRPTDECNFNGVCEPAKGESKATCPEDCSTWLDTVMEWLLYSVIAGAVLGVALVILSLVFPPLGALVLTNPLRTLALCVIGGFLIASMFTIPVAALAASLV